MPAAGTCWGLSAAKARGPWPRCASDHSIRPVLNRPLLQEEVAAVMTQIDDAGRARHAQSLEHEYERAYARTELGPRHQRHDDGERTEIENEDTQEDAVGCPGQHDRRVLRLARGHA